MKSSLAARSMKLLQLATQVGSKELGQTLKEQFSKGVDELSSGRLKTRIEQARLIAEHLSQLKGAAMKAGQLLSLDASDYFPPEAIEILSKLQGQADPMKWEQLRVVLEEDLGAEKLAQFENLSETAAASASIGQVHRARLNGRDVAIKIQYPGIADSIDSDLSILKTVAQSMLTLTGRRIDLKELFDELSIVLKQEADYELERENMKEFRRLLEHDPDFVVPEPIDSHCSKRVLTMTWQEGLSVNEWLKKNPSRSDRERVGTLALNLYSKEFFEWGFVQTDPNYGNFLIQENPLKLVLLDFGAALRYTREFREDYVELLKSLATLDRQKIIRRFTESGLIDPRESDEAKELFCDLLVNSLEPFQPSKQPFRFRDDDYARRSRDIGQRFTQSLKYSPPPRKILFLHRKLGGVFTLLKKLDVQINVLPYWDRMVGSKIHS
jgi:aarF domain-containing kinase